MRFLIAIALGSSVAFANTDFKTETDLGPGNREVASRYQNFEAHTPGCQAVNSGPRVLLTGFGLFEGISFNPSGAVIANLADPGFWPAGAAAAQPRAGYVPHNGVLADGAGGAHIYNRALTIGGKKVSACLIITDVLWDFSGAVFAREMDRFQPDVVIMSGMNGDDTASVEAGALNYAEALPGYASNGSTDYGDVPVATPILPGAPTTLRMTWSPNTVAAAIRSQVRTLGYVLEQQTGARSDNDYICNNVSYVALAAAQNRNLLLAGGLLRVSPNIKSSPKVGFFHYPINAQLTTQEMVGWATALVKMAQVSL